MSLDENTWIVESNTDPVTITLPDVTLDDIRPDASGKQKKPSVVFVSPANRTLSALVVGRGLGDGVHVAPGRRACFMALSPLEAFGLGLTPIVVIDEPLFWKHTGTT